MSKPSVRSYTTVLFSSVGLQDIFAYRRGAHGARPAAYFSHAFNRWLWQVRSVTAATFATATTASAAAAATAAAATAAAATPTAAAIPATPTTAADTAATTNYLVVEAAHSQ